MVRRAKKPKPSKVDGLGPDDFRRISKALRQVWRWSYPRRLCIERCMRPDGFPYCEKCGAKVAKVFADHITPVGEVDAQIIERLFIPSSQLQGLCKSCHSVKTKQDKKPIGERRKRKREAKVKIEIDDFY